MQRRLKQIIAESPIFRSVIVFLACYIILSALWLEVKDIYGYGITVVAAKFVAELKNASIQEITRNTDLITATFRFRNFGKEISVDVPVKVSTFAFNVPMIISMMVSLTPFLKRRKRAYLEALLILVLVHILHVFSLGALQLTKTFMARGMEGVNEIRLTVYHFLWGATEYATMSFAPFLIVAFVFVRFRNQRDVPY